MRRKIQQAPEPALTLKYGVCMVNLSKNQHCLSDALKASHIIRCSL
jgi:hypothetical protein